MFIFILLKVKIKLLHEITKLPKFLPTTFMSKMFHLHSKTSMSNHLIDVDHNTQVSNNLLYYYSIV